MNKVWIVVKWFAYEGEDIIGVYDSEDKALARQTEEEGKLRRAGVGPYFDTYEWDVE